MVDAITTRSCLPAFARVVSDMYATLLTVLICLATQSSSKTTKVDISAKKIYISATKDLQYLKYVYAIFRHGIRSPESMPYPNDPNKSKYPVVFPGVPGKLTRAGKQEMYKVGKNLQKRYGNFVGEYTQEKVHVSATNISTRTEVSALCVMAGQFPPREPIFPDLVNWQPIPVFLNTTDFDKVYIFTDIAVTRQVCPRIATLLPEFIERLGRPDPTKGRQDVYRMLKEFTGDPNANSLITAYGIFDTLQFESLNGLPLPAWAIKPQPQFQNKPLYPDLLEPIVLQFFYETLNKDILPFYAGPILNNVHQVLERNAKGTEEKYRFHASHDTTLFALLEGLGLRPEALIEPGDGVIFEVHQQGNTPIVKVLYYHSKSQTVEQLVLPSCPAPCALNTFIQTTPGLTPQQFQERCNI